MLSFSRQVKEEIVFNEFDIQSMKALLSALIKITGTLHISHGLILSMKSENAKIASLMHRMLKEIYEPQLEIKVSKMMKLHKHNMYTLQVSKAKEILDDLELMDGLGFPEIPSQKIVYNQITKRAYLAGVFLGSGSVNPPETSNYHLEMSVLSFNHATYIESLMNEFELNAKVTTRRKKYMIYIKSAEKIGDFLRLIGASKSVMNFEMIRIDRSMSNTVNRWNNCDIANEMKAMSAAEKQVEDIAFVIDKVGLEILDQKTQDVAKIRLENPELSLKELAEIYLLKTGQTISKSGLHHRFKKIHDEAVKLKNIGK